METQSQRRPSEGGRYKNKTVVAQGFERFVVRLVNETPISGGHE
jgi:hypothetical protein